MYIQYILLDCFECCGGGGGGSVGEMDRAKAAFLYNTSSYIYSHWSDLVHSNIPSVSNLGYVAHKGRIRFLFLS